MKRHCSPQVPKKQWNAGPSSTQASLSFSGRRVAWGTILKSSTVFEKAPEQQSVLLLLLLLLPVNLISFGTRINAADSFKWKSGVDNNRHTNAHQALPNRSPTEVSIAPFPPGWPWVFGHNCTQLGFKYFLGKRLGREVWCRQGNEVLRQICGWLLRSNARRPFGGLLACVGAAKSVRKRNLSPIPRPQPRRRGGQTEAALVI